MRIVQALHWLHDMLPADGDSILDSIHQHPHAAPYLTGQSLGANIGGKFHETCAALLFDLIRNRRLLQRVGRQLFLGYVAEKNDDAIP